MKTPWSFDDDEVPDDIQSADSSSGKGRRVLVLGLLCWGLLIGSSVAIFTAGSLTPTGPQSTQLQMPETGLTVTDTKAQFMLPIGGKQFGAVIQFKPTVRADLIIAGQRIPFRIPG